MKKSPIFTALMATMIITMISCKSTSTADPATTDSSAGNAALENIMTRTSVRQYAPGKTIPKDTVELLLRAAMSAPTAVNRQPWQFIVIDNRESLDSLSEVLPYAKMLEHASIAIVPCGDLSKAFEDEPSYWIQDLSAATENLLLAAHSLGLGAVWTGVYPTKERVAAVSQQLGLPANVIPLAVVPIGYPLGDHKPKDKWNPEAVHFNHWSQS